MKATILKSIDETSSKQWNHIAGNRNPFIRHQFLAALEHHNCVGERFGWIPQHIAVYDSQQYLIGAMPMYLKDNSYGEFIFDWDWADAYQRSGLSYYPKLVASIPYTPVTGPRMIIADNVDSDLVSNLLIKTALENANRLRVSSVHCLFTNATDTRLFKTHNFLHRMGYQFHWQNQNYRNFDDFLMTLSARKRKSIKRERRYVREANIDIEVIEGANISQYHWQNFHRFYRSTFLKLGGYATLSEGFFQELGDTMPENLVLIMAYHDRQPVASAFCLRGPDALYGRHWGCDKDFKCLHFEACYYQGIEYCIKNKLTFFEPGAQGEHKISRGFLPSLTHSVHWIAHPQFKAVIDEFLQQERVGILRYIEQLNKHSPYKLSSHEKAQ